MRVEFFNLFEDIKWELEKAHASGRRVKEIIFTPEEMEIIAKELSNSGTTLFEKDKIFGVPFRVGR
jgi:hypothetical protein